MHSVKPSKIHNLKSGESIIMQLGIQDDAQAVKFGLEVATSWFGQLNQIAWSEEYELDEYVTTRSP